MLTAMLLGPTLSPGGECQGRGLMHFGIHVCMSVCLSVLTRQLETVAPINLILHTKEYSHGSVLLR